MSKKDLRKVEQFIERYNKLPKDGEFIYKTTFGNPTHEDKVEATKMLDEIDSLFIDIVAFVKVKFGQDSSYIKLSNSIDFATEIMGIKILTNDKAAINRSWIDGMTRLGNMLGNLKAEVKEILENEPDALSLFKEKEEKKLKWYGLMIFWGLCFSIPIAIAIFFVNKVMNWGNINWKDIMTWINPTEFSKVEFLIIIVEAVIVTICAFVFHNYKTAFTESYYKKFKIKY